MLDITFEFVGGPNDGKVIRGPLGEGGDAERYFLISDRGRIGHRFKVASRYAIETLAREALQEEKPHHFQRHYYLVTDRQETDDGVWVRAEYVPPETAESAEK